MKDFAKNYIELYVTIEEPKINKEINLLGVSPQSISINATNSTLYIDNKKIENFSFSQKFPNPGTFQIKIETTEVLSDLSNIFSSCKYITKIDLSHLNLENVTSMK